MRAPDKIHIGCCDPSLERGFATSSVEKMKSDDIEYIRKEALLEWAKTNKEKCGTILEDDFWQEVINKLNSL